MRILLIFFISITGFSCLFGQRKSLAEADFKVFLDADMGVFVFDGNVFFEVAVGAGYRFSETMSVGAEYRRNNRSSCCNIYSMQGVGGFWGFQKGKIAGKISGGPVLNGGRAWDGIDIFEYKDGGFYVTGELKYYFWKAFRVGVFYTQTNSMNFDYYAANQTLIGDEYIFDRVEQVSFPSFGISIGATIPPRGK